MSGSHSLRLSSDYFAPTPVWTSKGTVLQSLDGLGVSETLAAELLAWQAHFDAHFSWHAGWDDARSRDWYATEGPRLRDRLRRELPGVEVELDLWPVSAT